MQHYIQQSSRLLYFAGFVGPIYYLNLLKTASSYSIMHFYFENFILSLYAYVSRTFSTKEKKIKFSIQ